MTHQDLAAQIQQLPLQEKLELLDVLTHSLKDAFEVSAPRKSSLERIRGIAKPDGEAPTDAESKNDYTEYLARKYS